MSMIDLGADTTEREEDRSWVIFFIFASWAILTLLLYTGILKDFMLQSVKVEEEKKNQKILSVLVENPDKKEEKPDPLENALSNRNKKAQWLEKNKKRAFNTATPSRNLSFAGKKQSSRKIEILKEKSSKGKKTAIVRKRESKGNSGGDYEWGREQITRIPENYRFQYREALSWDRFGYPQIPSIRYKYFEFFKNMLDKIQSNWAPPGGNPYPVYGDEYHSIQPVPGRVRFQTFPGQEIKIAFMLDPDGNVLDVRLISSLGYKSLDASCIEAIRRAGNFGKVPPDLLENGRLIIPMLFRIIVR